MDLFALIPHYISVLFTMVLPFLFVLTVVVFFHELGHFLVARWAGVKVTDFSIGFGKEIFGFNDKHGTRWRLAWLPLGGYVKFAGDDNAASVPDEKAISKMSAADLEGNFHSKPLAHRAAVVAAGPIANFILAIVIFAGIYSIKGEPIAEPRIGAVQKNSVAEKAGLRVNDLVKSIDGKVIESFNDIQEIVMTNANTKLFFDIERNGQNMTLPITQSKRKIANRQGNEDNIALLAVEPYISPKVGKVVPGSAADKAGFKPNDLIVRIGEVKILTFNRIKRIVSKSPGKELQVTVLRDGANIVLPVTPSAKEITNSAGKKKKIGLLGVGSAGGGYVKKYNPVAAVAKGAESDLVHC